MIVEAKNVSVKFRIGDFVNIGLKEYIVRKIKRDLQSKEFSALSNINFTINEGDMFAIIGRNGAGKSTLLKVVSGIMEPTTGSVKCNGSIAALLELGTGFDGELTVKENTYLRGALLGYTREYMKATYNDIISFAELENFQDRPFKHLSSGMKSKLAFSISSLIEPEILILDEVFAVGDGSFRKKSEAKMRDIIQNGSTTILVSHSVDQVRRMSNKVLWIDHGNQIAFGDTKEILGEYEKFLAGKPIGYNVPGYTPTQVSIAVPAVKQSEAKNMLPVAEIKPTTPVVNIKEKIISIKNQPAAKLTEASPTFRQTPDRELEAGEAIKNEQATEKPVHEKVTKIPQKNQKEEQFFKTATAKTAETSPSVKEKDLHELSDMIKKILSNIEQLERDLAKIDDEIKDGEKSMEA